jgi:hypothetical protein
VLELVLLAGLIDATTPCGAPSTNKRTGWLNIPIGAIPITVWALAPAAKFRIEGDAESVKSGVMGAATTRFNTIVCCDDPEDAVILPT